MTRGPVLVIGGPTASGKSGLALAVAEALGGVVINADSMQLYQGLPLLTAQPSAEDYARAPHRLYAALPPTDVCSAARWQDMALDEIRKAQAQKKLPVIVGGTGFYLKTLLEGLSPVPETPPAIRNKAIALQKEFGNPAFHEELKKRDPETAAKLDPFNTQRNVRAWEVLEATGKGLAAWQSAPRVPPPPDLDFFTVILAPARSQLYAACDGRFEVMLKAGALEEARQFSGQYAAPTSLSKALGYPELLAHLTGKTTLAEAAQLAQQSTRNYAKRQMTWFRNQVKADMLLETPDAAPLLTQLASRFGVL